MIEKEKQINLQVNAIRENLHEIMKDIEPRGLYNKLVGLDRQGYRIREILKEESKHEFDDKKRATKEETMDSSK